MKIIGLTGGIGSGKTTVSETLTSLGAKVICADQVSHELSRKGEAGYEAIVQAFGREYLLPNGELDRKKLGQLIFHSSEDRKRLNELIHPLVFERIFAKAEEYSLQEEKPDMIVLDVPLLIETGMYKKVEEVWLAVCEECVKIKRIMERDGMDEQSARARIASQLSDAERMKYADIIIDNSGTLEEMQEKVRQLYWRSLSEKNEK